MSCSNAGWDRTFLDFSSKMNEPFCAAFNLIRFRLVTPLDPTKFENCTTKTKEIATRVLIGLGAAAGVGLCVAFPSIFYGAVGLAVCSKVFRAIGFALQKDGYTHVRSSVAEKLLDFQHPKPKVMTWNVCGVGGGMSLDHGGVIDWRDRLGGIIAQIENEDPDILILQEVYDGALAENLIDRLQGKYAHFFAHLGANVIGSVGGVMVLSKCSVYRFSNTSFKNNDWSLNRGYATLELKATPNSSISCLRIIGTHFIHNNQQKRKEQFAQIDQSVTDQVPTIIVGDLNIERDQPEGDLLRNNLNHAYTELVPTCTNELVGQWDAKMKSVPGETIDYVSSFKKTSPVQFENCHRVEAFDGTFNTKTARSDHHGLCADIQV